MRRAVTVRDAPAGQVVKATVLVVDDDQDSRDLLGTLLQKRGFTVGTAGSGTECLQALDGQGAEAVVVLTDVEMPGMTGLELCGLLRERYPNVIAVVMSGRATDAVAAQAKESGAFTFLPKPIGINVLERVLREAMGTVHAA